MTKLSGALPKDHGLDDINDIAVRKPRTPFVVVGVVTPSKITRDVWQETEEATVAFESVEVLAGSNAEQVLDMLRDAHKDRTGEVPLPMEQATTAPGSTTVTFPGAARRDVDTETGEIKEDDE